LTKFFKYILCFQGPLFQKRKKIKKGSRDFFRVCIVGDAINEVVITCIYIILMAIGDL